MSTSKRHRESGGFVPVQAVYVNVYNNGTPAQTVVQSIQSQGTLRTCDDVVTRPFIPGKTIANNPLATSSVTRSTSNTVGNYVVVGGFVGHVGQSGEFACPSYDLKFDELIASSSLFNYSHLVSLASTSALSGIKKPNTSGMVAIKELKETINSILHPVDGALNWLKRNAINLNRLQTRTGRKKILRAIRSKAGKDEAVLISKDLSNQHLTIIFGIMPFISDIQSVLKALRDYDPLPQRYTSRGSASDYDSKSQSWSTVSDFTNERRTITNAAELQRTVSVRAYVLYEASVSIQDALGLSPKDIPRSVWEATQLSFVVDWFANVKEFISAITPVAGVTYVASGYTVTVVDACNASYEDKWSLLPGKSFGWTGSGYGGSQQRVSLAKTRVPGSLYANVGIHLKSSMHHDVLDVFKVTAGLSLLTQRLSKYL